MKPLVIYHFPCIDGFAAALAAWCHFRDEATYVPVNYGSATDTAALVERCRGRDVIMLDFSLSIDDMCFIHNTSNSLIWLDHHKTAFPAAGQIWSKGRRYERKADSLTIILDDNKSGAMLAWEYFHPNIPIGVKHIDDHDRWVFNLPNTRAYTARLRQVPWDFEQWRHLFAKQERLNKGLLEYEPTQHYANFVKEGEVILNAQARMLDDALKRAKRRILITGHDAKGNALKVQGLAANLPRAFASEAGHILAGECGTFGLVWFIDERGMACCSIRSKGEYDVSEIAKAFGGGGHRNAAGFEVPMARLLIWLA